MFKKPIILFLCLLYALSVAGIGFNMNYCGNRLQSVNVGTLVMTCPLCHSKAKMKCCHTSHIEVKVKDAHLPGSNSLFAKVLAFSAVQLNFYSIVPQWLQQQSSGRIIYYGQHAPPPDKDLVLIKNRVFRI